MRTRIWLGASLVAAASVLASVLGAGPAGRVVVGLAMAIAGSWLMAWLMARALGRRTSAIADAARRYVAGDLSRPIRDPEDDELGRAARALDRAVHALGDRLDDLSKQRAQTDAILSSMSEGVVVVNQHGHVQLANDVARRMLGIGDSPIGRHYIELIRHPEVIRHITAALSGGGPVQVEISLAVDPPRRLLASAASFAFAGEPGLVLVMHDVTAFRKADQIRQDFVANVSHELRTPLTAIRGAVDALLDGATATEEQRFLQMIGRHTVRMERLVAALLRLARLEAGQESLSLAVSSVASLFGGVQSELAAVLAANDQQVTVRIAPDATTVVADPPKLQDALRNLLENASNYAPAASTIELSAAWADGTLLLHVADHGPGIPEADLMRVFERFYRVDRARAREAGGTGLGLAIVKHLVGLHGGTVEAKNRPGGGAIFTVRLPQPEQNP